MSGTKLKLSCAVRSMQHDCGDPTGFDVAMLERIVLVGRGVVDDDLREEQAALRQRVAYINLTGARRSKR